MPSRLTRRSVLATGAVALPMTAAACAKTSVGNGFGSSGNSATPTPTPTPTPATLTIAADHPITELQPGCLLYTSPSPRDSTSSRMPSSA